jgi:plastocyanin
MKRLVLPVCALALAVSAAPAGAGGKTVKVADYKFVAKTVTISRGSAVNWRWVGTDPHNVTFHGFHSKTQKTGTFSHKFLKPGTYKYHCTIHGASFGMHGTIIVK